MKFLNNKGDTVPGPSLSPNKFSSTRNGLHVTKLLAKEILCGLLAKAIGGCPQTDGKSLLLKTMPSYSLNTDKLIWYLPRTFSHMIIFHCT